MPCAGGRSSVAPALVPAGVGLRSPINPMREHELDFALAYLGANRRTKVVMLSLGANDGFLLLTAVFANLNTISSATCAPPASRAC